MGNRALAYGLALAIVVADQLTKWVVTVPLQLQAKAQIVLLPIFNLTWVENHGISLGLFTANSDTQRWLLVAVSLMSGVLIGLVAAYFALRLR